MPRALRGFSARPKAENCRELRAQNCSELRTSELPFRLVVVQLSGWAGAVLRSCVSQHNLFLLIQNKICTETEGERERMLML